MTQIASNSTAQPYQQQVFQFIASVVGQSNVIAIPVEFVRFTGDYNTAAILTQLIYWQGKGKDPDGWIYKTYAEWETELALSKYQANRAVKTLTGMGILETKVARIKLGTGMYGDTAVHYHFNEVEFIDLFGKHLNPVGSKEASLPKSKKLHFPKARSFTSLPLTKTSIKDYDNDPPSPPPDPLKFKNTAQPPPPDKETGSPGDIKTAIAALCLLIPKEMRKPSTVARVAKAVADGLAMDLIRSCIEYSNDKSHKKTWQTYRSHLGQCIDGRWGQDYSTKEAQAEGTANEMAVIKARLELPLKQLQAMAKSGDKFAVKALKILKRECYS